MKKIIYIILSLGISLPLYAQTDGISYQAVIIDPSIQELPGFDISGNILPNRPVAIQFTIYDANNVEEYQEVHVTTTDEYGMVNLMIGQGEPTGAGKGDFTLIDWNGTAKSLQVEINFEGATSTFVDMARQELTFVPYAYHRNITATGDLTVDGTTDLNGEIVVQGPANFNSALNVNNQNATTLTGTLTVDGLTFLGSDLSVDGNLFLEDTVIVNQQSPAFFSGDITVGAQGTATFNGPTVFNAPANFSEIAVNGPSTLNGQVTVRANMDTVGSESVYEAYPLLVEGSRQGIAIRVNEGRSIDNNFVSFWDDTKMWGRIEGITLSEQSADPEYISELAIRTTDVIINGIEAAVAVLESGQAVVKLTAAGTSSTACAGLGACVTAPIPSLIAESSSNLILKIANAVTIGGNLALAIGEEASFIAFSEANIGVSYQSGAGDYAEWLPKENPSDVFLAGELVGIKNGKVTKNTWGAEQVMVVSTRPIVLGNMPEQGNEKDYVKIAFMGQVPVRVIGSVNPGDYILPSELGNGFAKAVSPADMSTRDYKKIVGVAWSVMDKMGNNLQIVNCAVGLNTNDLSDALLSQEKEIEALRSNYASLQRQMEQNNDVLARLLPGYAEATGVQPNAASAQTAVQFVPADKKNIAHSHEDDVVYFEMSREQIESAIDLAREQYIEMYNDQETKKLLLSSLAPQNVRLGKDQSSDFSDMVLMDISQHPFWQHIDSDPAYKRDVVEYVMSRMDKAFHTHEKYADKFTELNRKN